MTPQEQLCEKMRVEQSAYCLWLTAQPPEEILHHAYEYSVREDIILATEEMNLTPAQVRALLKSPVPLADVYKDFSKLETDYMSIVAQCVEDRADDLLKKEQQQNPPKVYRQSVTYAREHGELQQYHASCHLNERCRDEIDAALAQRFDGMRLGAGAVEQVVAEYGLERTKYVLAAAIQTRDGDGRISRTNREWADSIRTIKDNYYITPAYSDEGWYVEKTTFADNRQAAGEQIDKTSYSANYHIHADNALAESQDQAAKGNVEISKIVSSSGQSNGLELEGAGFTFFLVSDLSKLKQFEQTRSGSYTLQSILDAYIDKTYEYLSKILGKETERTKSQSIGKGSRGSSSDSLQTAGRELCMPDEIRRMRDDECLLLMRSEDPVIDRKYNLLKHPNVKYTPDAGGEPYVIPPDYMGDAVTITMDAVAAATAPEITEEMYEQLDYLEKHPEDNYYENEENFSQYDQGD